MTDTKRLLARIGTARDAISRKEEQTSLDYMIDGVLMECAVAQKEQEPVKSVRETGGSNVVWWYACGACKAGINPNDKFCHECGRLLKWDEL